MDLIGIGSQPSQILIYALLVAVPVLTASIGILLFMQSYYQVKFNKYGVTKRSFLPFMSRSIGCSRLHPGPSKQALLVSEKGNSTASLAASVQSDLPTAGINPLATGALAPNRRRVLIATMEYDIENWKIKIKIGGLGVMAQLMGKNLGHQDLIWVVPCVGDVEYPPSQNEADPMVISVLGSQYDITVHTHILRNITYVLLDAPVFRKQTKSDPYPERMDDLNSASKLRLARWFSELTMLQYIIPHGINALQKHFVGTSLIFTISMITMEQLLLYTSFRRQSPAVFHSTTQSFRDCGR